MLGREIPIESMQDMEIRLRDITGKAVLIRERVAVSSMVNQPILCFGRLLENGWCVDGQQQALTHMAGAHVPIELQNKSIVVQGEIRMLREEFASSAGDLHVRASQAMDYIVQGTVGWELDDFGRGIGRHFADRFQDPTLIRPGVSGPLFRTTLIEGDDKKWYVVEPRESVPDLIQLDAEFHELQGRRYVITILTDGEKDPMVMGFKLMDDSPERFPVQPEGDLPQDDDGQDVDIDVAEMQVEGQEIPVGQIAVRADPDDEIIVNGTKLKPTSRLAALRAGCAFYNLSSSGSKVKCFQRIAEHQKRLELEMVMAAAKDNQKELEREPHAPPTAEPPSELEHAKHRLTHLPYANWCPSCLMHRARPNRHERTGESHGGSIPTISFEFFYTRLMVRRSPQKKFLMVLSLIIVCSATGFISCVPLQSKNHLDHMNRELVQLIQRLGHSFCVAL